MSDIDESLSDHGVVLGSFLDTLMEVMKKHGFSKKQRLMVVNSPNVQNTIKCPDHLQKAIVSQFFTRQVLLHPESCPDHVRLALTPPGSTGEWLFNFRKIVIPFLMEHNLPSDKALD